MQGGHLRKVVKLASGLHSDSPFTFRVLIRMLYMVAGISPNMVVWFRKPMTVMLNTSVEELHSTLLSLYWIL